jgi:hypothetical protein
LDFNAPVGYFKQMGVTKIVVEVGPIVFELQLIVTKNVNEKYLLNLFSHDMNTRTYITYSLSKDLRYN